eukprot:TRINITY_DN26364_c0_g1_i1.p1 TRINITY_DN26364_c0_g1~~TRINITY_DN26364_c0_g1_i1.p1  ORF type:complete len:1262 (-),score=317.49 TRINITY_DN26364_c0_g1_i1:101-3793(-)
MSSAAALVGRSAALLRQDDAASALECAQEALDAAENEEGDAAKVVEISALCACAEAFVAKGDAAKATANAQQACQKAKSTGDRILECSALLVVLKVELLSIQDAAKAMMTLRETGASWGEMAVILSLAKDAADAGGSQKASKQIEEGQANKDRWLEALGLMTLAMASVPKSGPAATARDNFLSVAKELGVVSTGAYAPTSELFRLHRSGGSVQEMREIEGRLEAAKKAGQKQEEAFALLDLAAAKISQDPAREVPEADEALSQLTKLGSKGGIAAAQLEVSRSCLAGGRPVDALKAAREACDGFKQLGNLAGESLAKGACAVAHLALGQLPEAMATATTAPSFARERGLRRACAEALRAAVPCFLAAGEYDRALQAGLEAAAALRDVGDNRGEALALLREVASAYIAKKDVESALKVASAALRLLRSAEDLPGEVDALQSTARIHIVRGDTEPALRLLQEAVGLCRDSSDVSEEVDAHILTCDVWLQRSSLADAESSARAALDLAKNRGHQVAQARSQLSLAKVRVAEQNFGQAATEAQAAAAIFKTLNHTRSEIVALCSAWSALVSSGKAGAEQAGEAAKKASAEFQAKADMQRAGEALLEASRAQLVAGKAEDASVSATSAVKIFKDLGHTKLEAEALWCVVDAEKSRDRQASAVKAAVEVVSLFKQRGDLQGQADATGRLAKAYLDSGSPKEAISELREARLLYQRLGVAQPGEASLLLQIGVQAHMKLDDPPRAIALCEEAVGLYRLIGDRVGEAAALQAAVQVCVQQGDYDSALKAARQSVAVLARARLAREEAQAHHLVARVHLARLEPREAVSSAAQALTLLRRPGDEAGRAEVLETASWAHSLGQEAEGAVGAAEEAVALCRKIGEQRRLATALQALAEAQLLRNDLDLVPETIAESLALIRSLGDEPGVEAHLLQLSTIIRLNKLKSSDAKKKGIKVSPKDALKEAKESSTMLNTFGDARLEAQGCTVLAQAHQEAGNFAGAVEEARNAYELYARLRDGVGIAHAALLFAGFCLKSPARQLGLESSLISQNRFMPALDQATENALCAHCMFRRVGDEEGQEAALQLLDEIRALRDGSTVDEFPRDYPRQRPIAPGSQRVPVECSRYRQIVGARRVPCRTGLAMPKSQLFPLEEIDLNSQPAYTTAEPKPLAVKALPRSALANIENWDRRFERKAWHNVKATMSGLWEYPDMGDGEPDTLKSAEYINKWLEELISPEQVSDK